MTAVDQGKSVTACELADSSILFVRRNSVTGAAGVLSRDGHEGLHAN